MQPREEVLANNAEWLWYDAAPLWQPKKHMSLSEWADAHRVLNSKSSPEPGRWRTSRVPFVKAIMDAVSDPDVQRITFLKSSQVAGTEVILNAVGYFAEHQPSPMLFVEPTENLCAAMSKDRIAPMIADSPILTPLFPLKGSKDGGNSIMYKEFPGGHVTFVGANSPSDGAARPIRVVLADEIDAYPVSAGKEGDPLTLFQRRTNNFWNRKLVAVSTPRNMSTSRIVPLYGESNKQLWYAPCGDCGFYFVWTWAHMVWDKRPDGTRTDVRIKCPSCQNLVEHEYKSTMVDAGSWRAEFPERYSHQGFKINELSSPWRHWNEVREDFLSCAGNKQKLKVWTNTCMGEPWIDEVTDQLDWDTLYQRREAYDEHTIPDGALVISVGVDTQNDRFELEFCAYGLGYESWGVDYVVIPGDLTQTGDFDTNNRPTPWKLLEDQLHRTFTRDDNKVLDVSITCIDSGGKFPKEVKAWARRMRAKGLRVWATKGAPTPSFPIVQRAKSQTDAGTKGSTLWMVGVNEVKNRFLDNWLLRKEMGAGYCHFPSTDAYSEDWFKQLTAERKQVRMRNGQSFNLWVADSRRNEGLDCRLLTVVGMYILNPVFGRIMDNINKIVPIPKEKTKEVEPEIVAPPPKKSWARHNSKPRAGGFVGSWK